MKRKHRLFKPEIKQVTRFKMYKDGKNWITAGLSRFTFLTKKSDLVEKTTTTQEKQQGHNGLLKGLIGVGALLGGTVMTNSDVFADTTVANEKNAAADNLVDQNKVTIPAGSTSTSTQVSGAGSVSESGVTSESEGTSTSASAETTASTSTVTSDQATTSQSTTASTNQGATGSNSEAARVDVSTGERVSSTSMSESAGETSQVTSQQGSETTTVSTSESTSETPTSSTSLTDNALNSATVNAENNTANAKANSSVSEPDYPASMPRSNDDNLYDFWWGALIAMDDSVTYDDILISVRRDNPDEIVIREKDTDGKIYTNTVTLAYYSYSSDVIAGLKFYFTKDGDRNSVRMQYTRMDSVKKTLINKYSYGIRDLGGGGQRKTTFVPIQVKQTVKLIDAETGKIIETHEEVGWEGERYTSTSGPVREGYYIEDLHNNGSGKISAYGKIGAEYSQRLSDTATVTYTQIG
ncbi:KxYKxGKxW signal peptide domain-containing protein [Leuconostoc holzapfelii]|uniref:KxYKxGKxW signal peptide domain-containing protein n=1 Tax=Leuconostoc holzapfelii TaxID=434464 RepID=A0A846ZFG7_9LACO|nr:KxYKxGKxW signal peptide domain-containing protein [Leuconostoc holzapfelii]NKZ17652.1 KxYKxGKxW signal peptide domain-containing protein [Leuconostoc holzapfelii]